MKNMESVQNPTWLASTWLQWPYIIEWQQGSSPVIIFSSDRYLTDLESGQVQHGHTINELREGELEMSGVKFIVSAEQI